MGSRWRRRSSSSTLANEQGSSGGPPPGSAANTPRPVPEAIVLLPAEIDEESERRGRIRVQKRQSLGGQSSSALLSGRTPSGTPSNQQSRPADDLGVGGLTAQQLADNYANCMKLSAENKINTKNAFHLQLIDYMTMMMRTLSSSSSSRSSASGAAGSGRMAGNIMDNFQAASCALDASAKIYAYRVDSVHSDTLKLAGGIVGNDGGGGGHGEGAAVPGAEDNVGEDGGKQKTARKTARRAQQVTVVDRNNLDSINCNKFDLEFDVDPLFKKTSAQFDSGGTGGQFLSLLTIRDDDTCELLLDSSNFIVGGGSSSTSERVPPRAPELPEELVPEIPADSVICPSFQSFAFRGWTPEDDDDDENQRLPAAASHKEAAGEVVDDLHVFNGDVEVNGHDWGGGAGDFDDGDQFIGGEDPDAADDEDNEVFVDRRAAKHPGNNIREHLLSVPSEYSYFDSGSLGAWAGPRHWKFKPMGRSWAASAGGGDKSEKAQPSAAGKKSGSADHATKQQQRPHDYESLFFIGEALGLIEKAFCKPKKALKLARKTMENWDEDKTLLPRDLHYKGKDFAKLFFADFCVGSGNGPAGKSGAGSQQLEVDDDIADYDFDNEADTSMFCGLAADDAQQQQQVAGIDQQTEDCLDAPSGLNSMLLTATTVGTCGDSTATIGLVAAPGRIIEKVQIAYAKQAKKMDMRKLKSIEWRLLCDEKLLPLGDKENVKDNGGNLQESGGSRDCPASKEGDDAAAAVMMRTVLFSELYSGLYRPNLMHPKMAENLSVPLAFVALLHLANEKTLSLQSRPDMSDFSICQD